MSTKVKVKEYKRKTIVKAHTRHKPNQKMIKFDEPKAVKNEPKNEPKNKLKAIKYEPKNKLKAIKYEPKEEKYC